MSDYRDDRRALHARIESLESDASIKDEEIARLRAELTQANAGVREDQPVPLPSGDLAPPPRALPVPLMLMTLLSGGVFLAALLSLIAVVLLIERVPPSWQPVVALGPLAVSLLAIARQCRVMWLLRNGVAAPATLVSKRSWGGYQNATIAQRVGWNIVDTNYTGPAYRNRVRLGLPGGPQAEFTVGGTAYAGGIFVFAANNPRRRIAPQSLPVPLRPDERGQWRPLRANEGVARELSRAGQGDTARDVLGVNPMIFGWIKTAACTLAILAQLLVALALLASRV